MLSWYQKFANIILALLVLMVLITTRLHSVPLLLGLWVLVNLFLYFNWKIRIKDEALTLGFSFLKVYSINLKDIKKLDIKNSTIDRNVFLRILGFRPFFQFIELKDKAGRVVEFDLADFAYFKEAGLRKSLGILAESGTITLEQTTSDFLGGSWIAASNPGITKPINRNLGLFLGVVFLIFLAIVLWVFLVYYRT